MSSSDPHSREPNLLQNLRREFADFRIWRDRAIVLAYAVAAGLAVVGFTLLAEYAADLFAAWHGFNRWSLLLWTPLCTAGIVWLTRRFAPGAAGSGIPQVIAALDPEMPAAARPRFVSLRVSAAKILLSSAGLLGGLSVGREGPSVQVAAGIMAHAQRWLGGRVPVHALLVAGGAAGIAAAFNAPLAGIVFAIEELSRKLESRSSGLIIAAIVLAGLMAVSAFGNLSYFGVIRVPHLQWTALAPGLLTVLVAGVAGGLFARLLAMSLTGGGGRLGWLRAAYPVRFAAGCGLAVAVLGLASGGASFGAGSEAVKHMLAGHADVPLLYVPLKFLATWLTAWSGVPGGIFAPSLSIGAGIGHDVAQIAGSADLAPALIAMGMAAFLAAVTQAPLTSFIVVMEMVDGHSMVLSLMAAAMLASLLSRLMTRPLYETLADFMVAGQRRG
ncbi:chloride channel protein [Xylophilus rhododendri]|uniref:Chloride channel protein n=1 Tax=Xylophilus rhododendri TaxID=2697032 RepID=A0A857J4L0_9BURK|nr:chloride channel protein [Xylophilus rhododendri]QHI98736.1 chloride channel protein [Xylophilus rhododendri]